MKWVKIALYINTQTDSIFQLITGGNLPKQSKRKLHLVVYQSKVRGHYYLRKRTLSNVIIVVINCVPTIYGNFYTSGVYKYAT